jgi:acetylornithine deacetylase/succinyl-diaminopimelate desuccinylase-like protein
MLFRLVFLMALLAGSPAQAGPDSAGQVRAWRQANEQLIIDRFDALLRIPNVASDSANIRRNALKISAMLGEAGMDARLLELDGANPAVYAERLTPGADTTILIYAHYDGQPVNAADWASDPWVPVMRTGMVEDGGTPVPMTAPFDPEWRIFGRSAGDDKAPVVALQSALLALDAAGLAPTVNLKVFMEGEEEAGSPHLRAMLEEHRELLAADLWLFCDGPVHQSRRWQLVYGVRGHHDFELTVYGANRPLHSGHYGNWAPNPIILLTDLIASMRDQHGQVYIPGFYEQVRPLSEAELAAIRAAPRVDKQLIDELGLGRPETEHHLGLAITRPGLNLRGIRSGDVGAAARNAIPVSATASIGLRLVPDQTPEHLRQAIEAHIREQDYALLDREPTAADRREHERLARISWGPSGGYPAYRADFDHPLALRIAGILDRLSGGSLIQTPTMGGSLPIYIVAEVLDTPVLILPVANHDNNQHGANENLRLKNLWDAIEIYAVMLTGL